MTDNLSGGTNYNVPEGVVRIGIVIPTYPGNAETDRCLGYLRASAAYVDLAEPGRFEFFYAVVEGVKIPARWGKELHEQDVPAMMKRDREIARIRWDGMAKAFDQENADWMYMIDTDVVVPPEFFAKMLHYWPKVEAKTCHIEGTETARCRHLDDRNRMLPDDTTTQLIAGEVIVLRRSLWERMRKDWQPEGRMNEDMEIAQFVREAGAVYYLVPVRCWAD